MGKVSLRRRKERRRIFLLLLPILLFSLLFVYYPFLRTVVNAFSRVNSKGEIKGFVGLENFRYTYSRPDFLPALIHTLTIAAINVPLTLFITLSLALLTEKSRRLSPLFESLFSLPMAVSMSAACMIFKSMFSPSVGFINYFFSIKCGWYESTETALISCVILTIWMGIGFDYLLLLSALRGIPKSVREATMVDVLALMTSAPMIIIMGVSSASGATNTLMSMMYQSGFSSSDYGLSAVMSLTAFVLTLSFTILSFVVEKRRVHYDA